MDSGRILKRLTTRPGCIIAALSAFVAIAILSSTVAYAYSVNLRWDRRVDGVRLNPYPAGTVEPNDVTYLYRNPDGSNLNIAVVVTITGNTGSFYDSTPASDGSDLRFYNNFNSDADFVTLNVSFYSCDRTGSTGTGCDPVTDGGPEGVYVSGLTAKDLDSSLSYQDQVVFAAKAESDGATIQPDLIQLSSGTNQNIPAPTGTSTRADTVYATRNISTDPDDPEGQATATYSSEPITSFSVRYENGPNQPAGNPSQQWVWFSRFTFTNEIIMTQAVIDRVEASTASGGTVMEWQTGSEVGTAGFHVKRYNEATDTYVRVNDVLIPSVGAPQGGTYRLIDPNAVSGETYRYKLVELEYKGKKRRYGPYEVTVDGEGYGRADTQSNKPPVPVGVAATSLATQATEMKREQSRDNREARRDARKALRAQMRGAAIKLAVEEQGLYFVSAAEMATAFDVPEARVQKLLAKGRLKLEHRGELIAWHAAEDDSGLYFYGEAIDSPFTEKNVYWIRQGQGLQMAEADGGSPSAVADQSFLDSVIYEEDDQPWTTITSDPDSDYWYWDFVTSGSSSVSAVFDLPVDGVTDGDATLVMHVKGVGLDGFGSSYAVDVSLNGTPVGGESWSGTEPVTLEIPVTLQPGNNQATVTGVIDLSDELSYILVDRIGVSHRRNYEAASGVLALRGDGNEAVTVADVDGSTARVLNISNAKAPIWLNDLTTDSTSVSFVPQAPDQQYLVADGSAVKVPQWLVADQPSNYHRWGLDAEYLVITPSEWTAAAQSLADLRTGRGLTTAVVTLEDIYDEESDGIATPHAIKDFLARMYRKSRGALKYVVLLGEGSMDYRDLKGFGDSIVPTWMATTPDGLFASDIGYGDVKGSTAPEIIVSRLPVESEQEIADYVLKLTAHEGSRLDKVLVVADVKDDGAGDFPADAEGIAQILPAAVPQTRIYAQADAPFAPPFYSVADAGTGLRAAFADGTGLIDYSGHGSVLGLGSGLLRVSDIAGLGNTGQYPVLLALTCVVNRYDLTNVDALGEQLVLSPETGAIAVLAPSGLSLNSGAQTLNQAMIRAIYGYGDAILGDALRRALGEYVESGQYPYMASIYNLVGDPVVHLDITQTDSGLIPAVTKTRDRKQRRQNGKENEEDG